MRAMDSRSALPRGIWVLGFVSLLMDISSETIHSLLPIYLTATLGASALVVGLIEGVAEAATLIVKVFSGTLSDRIRKRQWLVALGYGLAAACKPFFALATGPAMVFAARFADRVAKGIRGAPRDALIADLAPENMRGAAFGLRQALDSVGAFAGPALAFALMLAWNDDIRAVFWVAVIPGVLSFLLAAFGVREPERRTSTSQDKKPSFDRATLRALGSAFWAVTAAGSVLTLARFSEAFLILRAADTGLDAAYAPLVLVVMNVVYAASSYPAGKLADRLSRRALLIGGSLLLVAADVSLAFAGIAGLWGGLVLWGLHMGFTQGLLSAMVAHATPAELRGTAFGVFGLASGLATLAASAIAGALWQFTGPAATFAGGAVLAGISVLLAGSILHSRSSA
jgi:MFS family permease